MNYDDYSIQFKWKAWMLNSHDKLLISIHSSSFPIVKVFFKILFYSLNRIHVNMWHFIITIPPVAPVVHWRTSNSKYDDDDHNRVKYINVKLNFSSELVGNWCHGDSLIDLWLNEEGQGSWELSIQYINECRRKFRMLEENNTQKYIKIYKKFHSIHKAKEELSFCRIVLLRWRMSWYWILSYLV